MTIFNKIRVALVTGILLVSTLAAWNHVDDGSEPSLSLVPEKVRTQDWPNANIDSVALWRGEGNRNWLFVTGKTSNLVYVCDAITGERVHTIGSEEVDDASLSRPNGVLAVDDVLYVVERDNTRVQVFSLPTLHSIGTFGEGDLKYPYGITVRDRESHHEVFITDNYDALDAEGNPVPLDGRIKQFEIKFAGDHLTATLKKSFGPREGSDTLVEVETLLADPTSERLLVCDEVNLWVEVYNSDGVSTGERIGEGTIEFEPEGMIFVEKTTLHPDGVLVVTDQGREQTILRIYSPDGKKYLGAFSGEPNLANTDGICFFPGSFGPFEKGALFCVHDDLRVQGYSWGDVEKGFSKSE